MNNHRNLNKLIIGTAGPASKTITFKASEFKKELAPANSKIDHVEMDGEKCVRMTYWYGKCASSL